VIGGVSEQAGGTINLGLPAEGSSLTLQYVGPAITSSVNFKMTRETEQGVQVFNHSAIPLVGGDLAQFQFGNWTGTDQSIPLVTSHNGQQSTQTLANQ
jgi:hypothetical protein